MAGTFTSGSTPVPSQLVFEIGLIALRKRHTDHKMIIDPMA